MNTNILDALNIPSVSPDRHYWIIRTKGGQYYNDFVLHQYISEFALIILGVKFVLRFYSSFIALLVFY